MIQTELPPAVRRNALGSLLLARMVYAFNWYNVGAVLPLVGGALSATTPELGIVLGAFLAGAGIFQVPAGLAAIRWGNRTVALVALAAMGAFCLASAFSPSWPVLALLRFGAGAGAAFFFAPALSLVASYYPAGARGPIVGLYNSGFSIGSAGGLLLGAVVGATFGWPWALGVGGAALLVSALVAPITLPRGTPPARASAPGFVWASARPVLRSRALWALALSFTGLWSAFYVAAQYFVQYAHEAHPGWSLALAAGLPTLMIALEVPAGPFGGWFGERRRDMRWTLVVLGVASAAAILLIPWSPLLGLLVLFPLLGVFDGVMWAVLYLLPSYLPETRGEGLSLGLGLLNAINIFGGSGLAIAFGFIAAGSGYGLAWVFAGVAAVVPLPLLTLVRGQVPREAPASARGVANPP